MDTLIVACAALVALGIGQLLVSAYVIRALLRRLETQGRFLAASANVEAYLASCRPDPEPETPMTEEELEEAVQRSLPFGGGRP